MPQLRSQFYNHMGFMVLRHILFIMFLFSTFFHFEVGASTILSAEEIKRTINCEYEDGYCKAYGPCTYQYVWHIGICYEITLDTEQSYTIWLKDTHTDEAHAGNLHQFFTVQPGDQIIFHPVSWWANGGVSAILYRDGSVVSGNLMLFGDSIIDGKEPPDWW